MFIVHINYLEKKKLLDNLGRDLNVDLVVISECRLYNQFVPSFKKMLAGLFSEDEEDGKSLVNGRKSPK